jgi:HEAT repeat protein
VTSQPNLIPQLQKAAFARASDDPRQEAAYDLLRVAAAFSLGIIGGEESRDILANMLTDAHPDVRYNAATGLARMGDDRALPRLKEMIQVDNEEAIRLEEDITSNRKWKQQLVIKNGLEALSQLYAANPSLTADSELTSLLEQLDASADIKGELRIRLDKAMAAVN